LERLEKYQRLLNNFQRNGEQAVVYFLRATVEVGKESRRRAVRSRRKGNEKKCGRLEGNREKKQDEEGRGRQRRGWRKSACFVHNSILMLIV